MITSKQNALVKQIRSLHNKKYRDELGLYVVEGLKMVKEALCLCSNVKTIVCTQNAFNLLGETSAQVQVVSDQVFDYITGEKSPQGIIAVITKPQTDVVAPTGSAVFLDGVADPGNLGTVIRTMACVGIKDLYLTTDGADAFSPKTVRSSMSGIFHVNVHVGQREQILDAINLPLIVADMGGQNVFEIKQDGDFCLVIGNEAHGVSQQVKAKADKVVSIPMKSGMESLNAGVSAGILMYVINNGIKN